jgi:hypothetical protein
MWMIHIGQYTLGEHLCVTYSFSFCQSFETSIMEHKFAHHYHTYLIQNYKIGEERPWESIIIIPSKILFIK